MLSAWAIMFFCTGVQIGSFPVFFTELLDYFGWSQGSTALGFTLNALFMAVFGPLAGFLLNRIGPKREVMAGAVIAGASLYFISMTSQHWHFYLTYGVLLPLGIALAFYIPTVSTVRRWFSRRAGLTVSLAMTGSAAGLAAGAPFATWLINQVGWQTAYQILAAILASGIIGSAFLLKKDPESAGTYPDGIALDTDNVQLRSDLASRDEVWSIKEAFKTSAIWLYMIAQAGYMVVVMAMMAHMVYWGDSHLGLGREFAVSMVSTMAVAALIGRLSGGFLSDRFMDRFGRKPILAVCAAGVAMAAFLALYVDSRPMMAFFTVLLGWSYGLGVGIFPVYLGDLYGVRSLPVLLGFVGLEGASIAALGPWIFGTIYDRTGNYDMAFIIGGALALLSLATLLMIRTPIKRKRTVPLSDPAS